VSANSYPFFFKQRGDQVLKCTPMQQNMIKEEVLGSVPRQLTGQVVVGLPNDRVFVIGGSNQVNGGDAQKECTELVNGQWVSKAAMFNGRSQFGCAVYPNHSQIFIAGGSINGAEATRACERYIVKDDQWKRLPELKEAKMNIGLCFFNNGGTLYCFGGCYKQQGVTSLSSKVERLSKGQNTWQILELRMPAAVQMVGAHQIDKTDHIVVFGGLTDTY
jgi:N-acetylneuraminic acid mutarotase